MQCDVCVSLRTVTPTSHESGPDCKQNRLQETEQVLQCHAPSPSFSLSLSLSLSIPACLPSIVSRLAVHYLSSFIVVSVHVSPSSFTLHISLWSCRFMQLLHFNFTHVLFFISTLTHTSTFHQMSWRASLFTCYQTRFLTLPAFPVVSRSVRPTHGWRISSIDTCRMREAKIWQVQDVPALLAVSNQSSVTSVVL